MAEEKKDERPPSKMWGWLKTGIGSLVMATGGAALMYVSPIVTTVIKPAKPVANFGHSASGLTVTFQDRSSGAYEGWWDFGDGSPLEPFNPDQDTFTHTYPRPGAYTAKLHLRNLVGDENERTVAIALDGSSAVGPQVESFQVVSLRSDYAAPATFRVVGKVRNAEYCIWALGEDRPLEISPDVSGALDRLVTIKEPGYYTFRLVAVGGKKTAEKSESVFVGVPNTSNPEAMLQVTYDAVRVERQELLVNMQVKFPPKHGDSTYAFKLERSVEPGFDAAEARFAKPVTEGFVRNAKVEVAADKKRIILTGELTKAGLLSKTPPSWVAPLVVTLEKRSAPVKQTSDPVMVNLNVPGTTVLPMPTLAAGWVPQNRTLTLELRDGTSLVYRDTKLPVGTVVQMKSRPVRVTATEQPGVVRLEVVDNKAALTPLGH